MKAYITTVGTTPEAVFNPLWYLAEGHSWIPDEVYLLWNDGVKDKLEAVKKLVRRLAEAYNREIDVIADEGLRFTEKNPVEFRKKAGELVRELVSDGYKVIVDITPGRKFMSSLLLGAAIAGKASEITYLHLDDLSYVGRLLFEIPMAKQRLFRKNELTGSEGEAKLGKRTKETSAKSLMVSREDIMVLLDSLYMDGETNFPVKVDNRVIGTISLGENAELRVSTSIDLNKTLHGGSTMVKEAIIAGGIVHFSNWNDLISLIKRLKGDGRPLYIGFDTNALYFRVPSKLLNENGLYLDKNLIFDFVYSDEVTIEVGNHLNGKLPYDNNLGIYSNQPTPKARLASIGRVELEKIRRRGAERARSRETFHGDTKIALDYKAFAEEKDANVLVITLDERAYGEMKAISGSGLTPFKLGWNFSFGSTLKGSWENLRDTIYTLSVILGKITTSKYRIYGIWHGKTSGDWEKELVRISNFEYPRLFKVLGG